MPYEGGPALRQAVGEGQLRDIQDSYMQYLESSAAIYEINGDYAVSLFASRWCDFLNKASRGLCGDVSDDEALKSGRWICHEDCWATSRKSMLDKRPFEMECSGGIVIYAAPIIADDIVIGSNNAGISNPPADEKKIAEIADKYKVSPDELLNIAGEYTPRPEYVFNASRKHIQIAANTIANIFLRNQEKEELKAHKEQIAELLKERTAKFRSEIDEQSNLIKLITENISEVFWVADYEIRKILYISPAYEEIWGHTCKNLYDNPRSFIDAIHPEDKGRVIADLEVQKKGLPFSHEYRIIRPDGSTRWIWDRGFPDKSKGLTIYVGIAEDITERKLLEYSLIMERNKLKAMLDAIEDGVSIRDLEYNITYQSETINSIFGNRLGEKCFHVYENNDKVCEGCPVEMSYKDGKSHSSIRKVVTPEGGIKYYETTANPIKDAGGNIVSCLEIAKDITTKRMAEEALEASEEKYRNLLDDAVDAILIADVNGYFIDVNKKAEELFGITKDEITGMHYTAMILEKDVERAQYAFNNMINNGFTALLNIQIKSVDSSLIPVDINARVIEYGGKKVVQGIFRDIRERIELESDLKLKTEMLSELNFNLTVLVNNKVEEIRRKDQILFQQSKMAAMGEMIGAIAHQWRQPLNTLGLAIQDIKDAYEYGEINAGYIDNIVKTTMNQVDFMSNTIDVFRNFFKPSKEKETFDVIGVSSEAFSMLSSQLKTNSIAYRISCHVHNKTFRDYSEVIPCDATVITTYKNQLAHVLLNLINNAKDAIMERQEKGLLRTNGMVAVDCYSDGKTLKVEISDNGGGIPEDIIGKIFEQYFTTKSDKGTGLGLYMSRVIVEESLGGKLYAENRDGGSVFTIELYV
ncbi:MAG: PAS domain S-box protein [Nitrospirae bacterium]|nr:PAS domain S-box protein [Nitrospirota bacterium]